MRASFRFRGSVLITFLFLGMVAAGCLDTPTPNPTFVATADGGVYFLGWDYDAATTKRVNANLTINVNEENNTGTIEMNAVIDNETYRIVLDNFSGVQDFHSGGIAANFVEHGDSGVGNALLPRMNLLLATWGEGKIATTRTDGLAIVDPYTGGTTWAAHLMVTDTGVRDDTNGKVIKDSSFAAYDPDDPGDAAIGNDLEAHLVFTSTNTDPVPEPANLTIDGNIPLPRDSVRHPFPVAVAGGKIEVSIDMGGDPNEVGDYTFWLDPPEGEGLAVDSAGVRPGIGGTTAVMAGNATVAGDWSITAYSVAAPGDFTAQVTITYPDKSVHYFFWEQVSIETKVVH